MNPTHSSPQGSPPESTFVITRKINAPLGDPEARNAEYSRLRSKVLVDIEQWEEKLKVRLSFDLDPASEDEATVIAEFAGPSNPFDIDYVVDNVNLSASREDLAANIRRAYRDEGGEVLGKDELQQLTPRELRRVLSPLAALGAHLYYQLFLSPNIHLLKYKGDDADVIRRAIRSALSRAQIISIQSPIPLFPWAFLYEDVRYNPADESTLNPKLFWGFKHLIQYDLSCTPNRYVIHTSPKVSAAVCTDADTGGWHKTDDHPFSKLGDAVTFIETAAAMGHELADFGNNCFYFFGHVRQPDPPLATVSSLQMRDEHLTVAQLETVYQAPRFKSAPVVAFLNGCNTAPLNVWDANSVAGFLCERGEQSACCVAAVAEIPGTFAVEFGQHFLDSFLLKRQYLGDAILGARLAMLSKWQNPLGLLYTIFGNVDTHFVA